MKVRDDGRGGVVAGGNGLNGMRERILAMAGQLDIRSTPGAGTELAIDVPLAAGDAPSSRSILSYEEARHIHAVALHPHAGGHP
jgi:signal transduction histidine kinase